MSVAVPTQQAQELHRQSADARVDLTTHAAASLADAPRLFAVHGSQRSPRCFGRVSHPSLDLDSWTDRQKRVRFEARRWWTVRCSSAADGARVIEQLLDLERTPLGYASWVAGVIERPDLRRILDTGRNARGPA